MLVEIKAWQSRDGKKFFDKDVADLWERELAKSWAENIMAEEESVVYENTAKFSNDLEDLNLPNYTIKEDDEELPPFEDDEELPDFEE